MNKKFFTLIAGLLMLAASLGTGHAQFSTGKVPTVVPESLVAVDQVYQLRGNSATIAENGAPIPSGAFNVLAQVQIASGDDAGRFRLINVLSTQVPLANTLWRLSVSGNSEEYPSFTFVNEATGQPLSFNSKTARIITTAYTGPTDLTNDATFTGGDVSVWKWQLSSKPASKTFRPYSVYSAFSTDSAVALTQASSPSTFAIQSGTTTVNVTGFVVGAVKYAFANNPVRAAADRLIYLTPYEAEPILLTADDLNSLLWTQSPGRDAKVKFSFTPEVKNSALSAQLQNLFTSNEYKAVSAVGFPADYALLPDRPTGTAEPNYYESLVSNVGEISATVLTTGDDYEKAQYYYQQYLWRDYEYRNFKNDSALAEKLVNIIINNRTGIYDYSGATIPTYLTQVEALLNLAGGPSGVMLSVMTDIQNNVGGYTAAYTSNPDPYYTASVPIKPGGGPRSVQGTAAHFIATNGNVKAFLEAATTTPFQKNIIEAIIALEETQLIDPSDDKYPVHEYGDILTKLVNALDDSTTVNPILKSIPATATAPQIRQAKASLLALTQAVTHFFGPHGQTVLPTDLPLSDATSATLRGAVSAAEATANAWINVLKTHEDARWVSLQYKEYASPLSPATYLSVDTSYITGSRDLGFKIQKFEDVGTTSYTHLSASDPARLDLNGRFNFQFQYFPTKDSIVIRTGGFAKKLNAPLQTRWGQLNPVQNGDLGIGKAGIQSRDNVAIDAWYYDNNWIYPDRNLVKLEPLTDRTEVTVGSSDYASILTPRTSINTHIRINKVGAGEVPTTLPDGLYFINLHTNSLNRSSSNGAYNIVPVWRRDQTYFAHEESNQLNGVIQNFAYQPATQWVIEQHTGNGTTNLVSIYNREYPNVRYENVQLYKTTIGAEYITVPFALSGNNPIFNQSGVKDSLLIRPVRSVKKAAEEIKAAYETEHLGYYKETGDREHYYNLDYLSGLKEKNFLKVLGTRTDSLIYVDIKGESVDFELVPITLESEYNKAENKESKYGYSGKLAGKLFPQLKREAYLIRVKAPNLLSVNNKFVVYVREGVHMAEPVYAVANVGNFFLLKENNRTDLPYFAIEETGWDIVNHKAVWDEGFWRVGVKDGELKLTSEQWTERRVAAFALRPSNNYLYRRFDGGQYGKNKEAFGDETNAPVWLQFFKFNNPESNFLTENSPNNTIANGFRDGLYDKTISFLGVVHTYQHPEIKDKLSYTFYVDTAYVRNKTVMPQYMLALNPDTVIERKYTHITDGKWIDEDGNVYEEDPSTKEDFLLPGLVKGEYLFNATDSVLKGNTDYEGKFSYGAQGSTRFAFTTGVHFRDTFYVLPDKYRNLKAKEIARDTVKYLQNLPDYLKHNLGENTHYVPRWGWTLNPNTGRNEIALLRDEDGNIINNGKSMVFQFRLIDDSDRRFLIETTTGHTYWNEWDLYNAIHRDATYPYTGEVEIAPSTGQWMAIKSIYLPVVSDVTSVVLGAQNTAEIFEVREGEKDSATANEAVAAETAVKVISENGAVTILNAAGKSVAISNILGQTVAASVLTSDNARIALPKGIVIVSVEGEAAIKAVVK
jgi:hypothetical protein